MAKRKSSSPSPTASAATQQKSWQARIGAAQDALAVQFVESLSFDFRLAKHDILGSIAHAAMLNSVKLLSKKDLAAIKQGLLSILQDIESNGGKPGGRFNPDITQEDIHMAIEAELIKRIVEPGRRLHTARSRNDQVALDIRLWCREAIGILTEKIADLQRAFLHMASEQGHDPMPSFTHLQRAQPIVAA